MTDAAVEYNLIIVGGGLAGLTAGVRALELDQRTLIIEKGEGESYPCNSRHSGGILHIGFLDPYRSPEDLTQVIEQRSGGDADDAQTSVMANNGARFLDWLQDKGAQFVRFNEQEGYRWCMAPPRSLRAGIDWQGRGPDVVLRSLANRFVELGGHIRRGTQAQSLLMQADRCRGVNVVGDGRSATIHGDYVLIADGGFQANEELYRQHISDNFNRVFQRGARTGMGDGLKMAVDAGASLRGLDRFYGHVLCRDALHNDNVWPYPEIDAIATSGVVVNATGQRLADEGVSGVFLTNELARASSDGASNDPANDILYAIFDAAIWEEPGRSARIPANPLLEGAGGTVLRADTIAELAALAGLPSAGLLATIDDYNAALASGTLDQLSVPRSCDLQPWPITEAPFMAIPVCPGITYTMGGIAIDEHAQVQNEDGRPIVGLLAAGAATGGLEGGRHAAYIGGLMKAGVFGLIAAERVAALEDMSTSATTLRDGPSTSQPRASASGASRQLPASAPARPPAVRPSRLAAYPMLNAVLRYGKLASIALSLIIAALVLYLAWQDFGMVAVALALVAGLVTGALALTFTELVRLITDMLLPS
jgi:fumarate reductase flavoprotein subunit